MTSNFTHRISTAYLSSIPAPIATDPAAKDEADGSKRPRRKKRKTVRACNHCQKSHLTCDDSRPCARCVKRGMADTCVDGARKKAKYLLDAVPESNGKDTAGKALTPIAMLAPKPTAQNTKGKH
ncbi:Transcriptional regulator of nonfermentable carbon utilization [Coemansia brasiliensis]|uniref:Transcriptional regulator of nonfermentable carbon utilization n=1 Tax=Coemansia brasiliensis TaxID=2650707 RepID=A0A9W8I4R7_9FUNG|nr:Transcriptional regulator of nonfermentable carbon utilization [Coemansia brasiliensis]